jgi:phosphoribosylformylglycinamidine cyclo-ligase
VVTDVVRGVALACKENGCALLGGETAQMPDFYAPGEYDLAGFIVGIVERDRVLDGTGIRAGDALVALGSSGLHTNGYTLARRIVFERMGLGIDDALPGLETPVSDALLAVHRSYLRALRPELDTGTEEGSLLHGLAHITGGGIPGNLPRILPDGLGAVIEKESWTIPPLFQLLQEAGEVDEAEMFRVFNMGVGMLAVVAPGDAGELVDRLHVAGEKAWIAGEITTSDRSAGARVRLV